VIRKLIGDLTSAGVETDETKIREALEHKTSKRAASSSKRRADLCRWPPKRSKQLIVAGIPMRGWRSPIFAATATIMPRGWSPKASGGTPRVRQHQRVYQALGGRMGGVLHALQLTTATPD
jgi:hypothetical protein